MEPTSTPPPDNADADPATGAAAPAEPPRMLLHMPVDVRSVSLAVLATLASVFMLRWASAVFIPVMVGLLFSYGLSPVVDWLAHRRIPRALSAAVLVLGIVSGVGATVYSLSDDAGKLVESLPVAAQKLRHSIRALQGKQDNTLATMQKAASQLEQAAEEANRGAPMDRGVQRVQIEKPKFAIKDYLWSGTMGLLAMLGQIGMVALITFFLVASGDTFRRKLVKLAGPTLSRKKITLQALNEINDQIQRYMLVQLFTSVIVGVATWLCFLAVGLEQAAVWGIAAGVLNLVPYIGNVIITAGSAMVGFLQFGTLEMALLVAGISLVINSIEGFLLTPWLTSRASKMNPVAIFVGVLAWGWLWGAWGLLLGVPILMVIKAICDRVEDLKPVGEFLGA
ncbi:MAG: AI-2E family transporter [Rhodoferax sp.]|uniref:AI-2E family transporter n=1 Tax=Rhodoferax sp. TaxID=50421 RepID=UPI00272104D2|nr:AI-2E family transporter [Rhodoferax sp.]MDO8449778.1 AI-2E family transporter [Rhodoferax sp.]